eukprot:CAMPEP_0176327886 /NCGR_PEP_ID=MMETSP0121_2-20121125/74679_1 /TAXON_ID=160619 /ORGANISM="Kryptoperidinium foliaceum, Strain CCMP 1326" /LENGTH=35 /DNA_ID= /DNA_START= /DNA_END= /DNA_ORIENTATION=
MEPRPKLGGNAPSTPYAVNKPSGWDPKHGRNRRPS